MDFHEYSSKDELMAQLSVQIESDLRAALDEKGQASLAVPGGTTPGPIFDRLSQTSLNWSDVSVMLTDERWVPETSERSNTRLLKERLFVGHAAKARYVPLYANAPTPEEKLENLEAELRLHLPLDVAVIGMGADMHTASIFPEADRLHDALYGTQLLVPMRAPGAPEPRITLSAPVLQKASHCHVVIIGDDKKQALIRAQNSSLEQAPIGAVLETAHVHWAQS